MKKSTIFLAVGLIMALIMVLFIAYAVGHPQEAFPMQHELVFLLYIVYFVMMVLMFILYAMSRERKI